MHLFRHNIAESKEINFEGKAGTTLIHQKWVSNQRILLKTMAMTVLNTMAMTWNCHYLIFAAR
jgi:hypothetical protein